MVSPDSSGAATRLPSGTVEMPSVPVTNQTEVSYSKLAKGTAFEMGVGVADLAGNFSYAAVNETVR